MRPGHRTCSGKLIMHMPLWLIRRADDPDPARPNDPTSKVLVLLEAQCRWRGVCESAVVPASWLPWNRRRKPKSN